MVTIRCIYCGADVENGGPSLQGVICSGFCADRVREAVILDTPKCRSRANTRMRWRTSLQWSCKVYYHHMIQTMGLR